MLVLKVNADNIIAMNNALLVRAAFHKLKAVKAKVFVKFFQIRMIRVTGQIVKTRRHVG
jgi:hypothetical protein